MGNNHITYSSAPSPKPTTDSPSLNKLSQHVAASPPNAPKPHQDPDPLHALSCLCRYHPVQTWAGDRERAACARTFCPRMEVTGRPLGCHCRVRDLLGSGKMGWVFQGCRFVLVLWLDALREVKREWFFSFFFGEAWVSK